MIGKSLNEENQKREIEREVQHREYELYSFHQESLVAQAQESRNQNNKKEEVKVCVH